MGKPVTGDAVAAPLDVVCRRIADHLSGARADGAESVGDVTLWPHQRDAVARVHAAISEFGGALLADDVGTGKTFVALAVASRYAAPLVVGPAALRNRWRTACAEARRAIPFASVESLSRGRLPRSAHDLMIVDEAHHCRNPLAKRYHALAGLCRGAPVLLLSATPIHNRRQDLVNLLALFLGASAEGLDDAALARCVIRRGRDALGDALSLPLVRGPIRLACDAAGDLIPDAILALPPPVPAADGGTAAALVIFSLLRQWASSQGALLGAVRRRLAVAHALGATLEEGRLPTRAELAAWTLGDDAQQLVLGALLSTGDERPASAELRQAVAAHAEGLREIRRVAGSDPSADVQRAIQLQQAWAAHPGARSIAFSQFAGTIDAYWRELRGVAGCCALTSRGARTAGGVVSRAEALGSFVPGPAGPGASRIAALLTTDLASEGIDLHDASVLVHLDLPWTPARLEQRVGRVVRPGSPHPVVHVYQMEPPTGAAKLLEIGRRLAAKLAEARLTLGNVMNGLGIDALEEIADGAASAGRPDVEAPSSASARLERVLARWRARSRADRALPDGRHVLVAVAHGARPAWLALVGGTTPRLVAFADDRAGDDPALVANIAAMIDALPDGDRLVPAPGSADVDVARQQLERWLAERRGSELAGVADLATTRGRRRTFAAVAGLAGAAASARAALAPSAHRALTAASGRLGAGGERALSSLETDARPREAGWLDAVGALGAFGATSKGATNRPEPVLALIVLGPQS